MQSPYEIIESELKKNGYQHLNLPALFPIGKRETGKKYARRIIHLSSISGSLIAAKRSQEFLDQWLPKGSLLRAMVDQQLLRDRQRA